MLTDMLNCDRALGTFWHLDYGITSKRAAKRLAPASDKNSFANPNSETALTLFVLGNIDRWKQVNQFGDSPPRLPAGEHWTGKQDWETGTQLTGKQGRN